ncbi:phage tail tape measure protein [Janibacter terrae]|uniref:phage tail tape measure protein n=1 Tax=Janibacter terrae TaxID=103817 RepID=UPI0031F806B9
MTQYIKSVLQVDASPAVAGFKQGETAVEGYSKALNEMFDKLDQRKHWDNLANNALVAGGALAIGLGATVKVAADFEQAMDRVGAIADATSTEMSALSDAALQAGEDTVFSATEAAQAQEELAKAGVSTADILGGALTGSLDLAAAGGLDLASSAEIAATSMNLFGLEGEDVTHIADVLTASANKSAAGVDDLGLALSQGGTVAAATGLTLEETAATLSAFADSGMKGSDAGTSLKTMLQRLSAPSGEAAKLMDELGVSAYDTAGQFVGMDTLAGQLKGSLEKLTPAQRNQALTTMFGSDAVRAANILYKEGAEGIADYVSAVDDQGAAARMASRMTDNLKGDVEELGGALETAFIKTGSGATDGLRSLVQGVEGVVGAYNDLPPSVQSAVFNVGAFSAAALLAGGATIKAVGYAKDFDESLRAVGFSADTTKGRMAQLAKVAAVPMLAYAVVELRDYTQAGELADVTTRDLTTGLRDLASGSEEAAGGVADMFREHDQGVSALFRSEEQFVSTGEAMERFGFLANEATRTDLEGTVARWMEGTGAFDESVQSLDQSLANLVNTGDRAAAQKAFEQLMSDVDPDKVDEVRSKFVLFQEALDNTGPAAGAVREALSGVDEGLDSNKDGWITTTEEIEAHEKALKDVQNQLEMLGGGFRAEQAAIRSSKDAYKEMRDVLKDGGGWTEMSAAMDDYAGKALSVASAQAAQGRGSETIAAGISKAREAVIQAGVDADYSREYMEDYADSIGLIPSEAKTMVEAVGVTESTANIMAMDQQIMLLSGKTVSVKQAGAMEAKGKVLELDGSILGLDGKTVKVTEIGSTPSGDRVVQLGKKIWVLKGKDVDITADTSQATSAIDGLNRMIAQMNGREINIDTRHRTFYETHGIPMGVQRSRWAGGIDGIEPMAAGGMRPGGSVRPGIYPTSTRGILMAEDTRSKWESYIPERPDLRGRAEMILAETARRFGKAVVPLTEMAAGGIRSYRLDEISERRWEELLAQGWRGRPGDRQERIYAPAGWGEPKARRYTGQHSAYYLRKQAEWDAIHASGAKGGTSSGGLNGRTAKGGTSSGAFMRSPNAHAGRTYVRPQRTYASTTGGSTAGAAIDYDRLGKAVARHIEDPVYRGAYAGTAQQRKTELANAANSSRGRSRGGLL